MLIHNKDNIEYVPMFTGTPIIYYLYLLSQSNNAFENIQKKTLERNWSYRKYRTTKFNNIAQSYKDILTDKGYKLCRCHTIKHSLSQDRIIQRCFNRLRTELQMCPALTYSGQSY